MLKNKFLFYIISALFSSNVYSQGIPDSVDKDELIKCGLYFRMMSNEVNEGKSSLPVEKIRIINDGNEMLSRTINALRIPKEQIDSVSDTLVEDIENPEGRTERINSLASRCVKILATYSNELIRIFGPPLPDSFVNSKVLLRPNVDDMGGIKVKKYIYDLLNTPLANGSYPKALDWTISENQYTLKIRFGSSIAILTFIQDLSAPRNGRVSMLMPIQFDGDKIDAINFSMLMRSGIL